MNSCTYYNSLKASPFAKDKEEATIEEVAIWLDINGGSTRTNIIKILKAIEKNYHDLKTDRLNDDTLSTFNKILRNSLYGINRQPYASNASFFPNMHIKYKYLSDNALYWIFKLFSETTVLDHIVIDKKFIDFVNAARDKHKSKSMTYNKLGSIKLPIPSRIDQALYEIFAELVDIVEDKMHRSK